MASIINEPSKSPRLQRGHKATGRNGDGVPTFTSDQVVHADEERELYEDDHKPLNRF